MATVTSEEIKAKLLERGLWADFMRKREDAVRTHGYSYKEARIDVLSEIAPDLLACIRPHGRPSKKAAATPPAPPPPPPAPTEQKPSAEVVVSKPTIADNRAAAKDRRIIEKSTPQEKQFDRNVFKGKSCSLATAFMWAYSNLSIADVKPEEAPSAVAWQMYLDMKTSPSLKADMIKSGLATAMRKAESESDDGNRMDGEGEYNINAAILEELAGK